MPVARQCCPRICCWLSNGKKIFRVRWWDYTDPAVLILTDVFCIGAALSFGVIGVLMLKVITPALLGMIGSLPVAVLYIVAGLLAAWLVFDILLSLWLIFWSARHCRYSPA